MAVSARVRTILSLAASAAVIGGAFIIFAVSQATKSTPLIDGELSVEGIKDTVEIWRTASGIPHIVGNSDEDAFYGIGYAHAQDRLWQMDLARRIGRGRLSEVFGKRTLEIDIFMRHIGIGRTAYRLSRHISRDSRMALDAYARGVNAYMQEHRGRMPFEFDALAYEPEPWTAEDCLVVARMMAWEMNLAFWSDLAFSALQEKLGTERARLLIPQERPGGPVVTDTLRRPAPPPQPDSIDIPPKNTLVLPPTAGGPVEQTATTAFRVRRALGWSGAGTGSNAWAIFADKKGSRPILASDPHLTLGSPARWYQAHITSKSMNVIGATIPGLPFVIIGRNDHAAWGITAMLADDCDFFAEEEHPSKRNMYRVGDSTWRAFKVQRDTIKVSDSANAIIDIRSTWRSAVISDTRPMAAFTGRGDVFDSAARGKRFLTFSWTGNELSDDVLAMYRLMKVSSVDKFRRAVSIYTVPGLVFVYADKRNIGVVPAARIPLRANADVAHFPAEGWKPEGRWRGFAHTAALPQMFNPSRGFVYSANNPIALKTPYFVSSIWEPDSRAERIHEMLSRVAEYDADEATLMQLDFLSPYARSVTPAIVADLRKYGPLADTNLAKGIGMLASWDYSMDNESPVPAIYSVLLERIVANTFADELDTNLYHVYTFLSATPLRVLQNMMERSDAPLFDNVRTLRREQRADVVVTSWYQAMDTLRARFPEEDPLSITWGRLHTLTLKHPMGEVSALNAVVNTGPFPMSGDKTTINCSGWSFHAPYSVEVGSSFRFVSDLRDSVVRFVIPGGNSGQPLSAHYSDQIQLALNGGMITLPWGRTPSAAFDKCLRLIPD